jgi:hypothetical protein
VVELVEYLQHRPHGTGVIAALAGSLVIAAVFGAIRAATVRVLVDDGQAWRQGNWLTALLLYFGVTFTIQRVILQARAQRIGPGNPAGPRNTGAPALRARPGKENRARESPRPSRARTLVRRTRWPGLIHLLAENPDKTRPA